MQLRHVAKEGGPILPVAISKWIQ